MKANCWESENCGRQPGGLRTSELGVCPATTEALHNGKNGGRNAGRYCWKVPGTLCEGRVQGIWATKMMECAACKFFEQVKREQGSDFQA